MNRIKKNKPITYTALLLVAAAMVFATQGCGGGGGGTTASSTPVRTGTGLGRVAAVVSFQPPESAARAAGVTTATYTVGVDISIEGYYSETGQEFAPIVTHVDVDYPGGHAQAAVMNVPIGVNHLLIATAVFPGASTQTLKAIIPAVSENVETTATADERSTAIANGAIALAAQNGKKLSEITPAQLEQVSVAVDGIFASGIPYNEISTESVLNYVALSSQVISLEITPATATIVPGTTLQFSIIAKNSFGVVFSPTNLQWDASTAIGTVSASGLLTAGTLPGVGTVTVSAPGTTPVSAMASVLVDYTIESATLTPEITPYAEQTLTQQFTFSGITPGGQTVDLTSLALWSPSSGLTASGAPGSYTFSEMGNQELYASYNGIGATVTFEVVEPPITGFNFDSTQLSQLTFDQSIYTTFTPIGGRAPFTFEVVGAIPPSLTLDPNTGDLSGYAPPFMSNWHFGIRVTDALGRSTSSTDPNNITDAIINIRMSVAEQVNEFKNITMVADGALANVTTLLNAMKQIAVEGATGSADYTAIDAQYQAMKSQIDDIANTTSYDGALTSTYGPILLTGAYGDYNLEVALSGGYAGSLLYTYLPSVLTSSLGCAEGCLGNTDLTDQGMSTIANDYVDLALNDITYAHTDIGDTSGFADYILDIDTYIATNYPINECYTDLLAAAQASNYLYGKVADILALDRDLVMQAGSGSPSQFDAEILQEKLYINADFLNQLSYAASYYYYPLLDGSFSATCPTGPEVVNTAIMPYDLGIDYIYVASLPYTADTDVAAIDAALDTIATQRATLTSQILEIQSLISSGASEPGGIGYTGYGGQLGARPVARRITTPRPAGSRPAAKR